MSLTGMDNHGLGETKHLPLHHGRWTVSARLFIHTENLVGIGRVSASAVIEHDKIFTDALTIARRMRARRVPGVDFTGHGNGVGMAFTLDCFEAHPGSRLYSSTSGSIDGCSEPCGLG